MGFFDDVNGPASAPVVKLEAEEMVRLRIITAPEDTKYGKAKKFWQHSCPNEQTHLFGGFCSIMCIGDRNGCIFHEEPFKWSCTSKIPINVIEYEMDKQQRLTGARSVKLWVIGNRVYDSIVSQFAINCIPIENLGERDFIVRRAGTKQATSYTVNIAPSNVELQIDWNFPEIPNGFGDETYPFLVDFGKVYGFQEMTAPMKRTPRIPKLLFSLRTRRMFLHSGIHRVPLTATF